MKTLKQKQKELEGLIKEYNDLSVWHNGSLLNVNIDIDEKDYEVCNRWIAYYNKKVINDIEKEIEKKYGIETKVYQAGRLGATFYPVIYFGETNTGIYKTDIEHELEYFEGTGFTDKEKHELIDNDIDIVKTAVEIIKLVNERVKQAKNKINEEFNKAIKVN